MEYFNVVIPARLGSTRFHGKPLALINNVPMICHTVQRAIDSGSENVIVATDDNSIAKTVKYYFRHIVRVFLSETEHLSGTSRIHEAVTCIGIPQDRIIVNLQGDEPAMPPRNIWKVAEIIENNPNAEVSSLYETTRDTSSNVVKVVLNNYHEAMYFSRCPIPYGADIYYRHVGIYGYRVQTLNNIQSKNPCALELTERLEQLRFLHMGMRVKLESSPVHGGPSVDTKMDIDKVEKYMLEYGNFDFLPGEEDAKRLPKTAVSKLNEGSRRE